MSNNTPSKVSPEAYDVKLPQEVYKVRCVSAESTKSKSGFPMDVLDVEIIENAPINGVDINGLSVKSFNVRTEKSLSFYNKMRTAFGLQAVTPAEVSGVKASDYIGQVAYVVLASKGEPRVNDVTNEPLKHPRTGEALVTWNRNILEWLAQ